MKNNKKSKSKAVNSTDLEVILHGEAMIIGGNVKIPAGALQKKVKFPFIIADSETTGNHHILEVMEVDEQYFKFYEHEGKTYLNSEKEATVRCVLDNRHDTIKLPAGTYEFGIQTEYDPFKARLEKVRD